MLSMAKCAAKRTPLWLRLWFYIIQGLTNALWKIWYQWPITEYAFFIVIHRFSLVKAAMNAQCICKMCNSVNKTPQKCAMNIHRLHLNSCTIANLKTRRRSNTLKAEFSKKSKPKTLPFIKIYRMSLISAGSISLDSAFNKSFWCIDCDL
jgi:hypothetical protein